MTPGVHGINRRILKHVFGCLRLGFGLIGGYKLFYFRTICNEHRDYPVVIGRGLRCRRESRSSSQYNKFNASHSYFF